MVSDIEGLNGRGVLDANSEGIATLIRSMANPSRVKLLALMLRGDGRFSSLKVATGLSKTALANHLSILVSNGLVRRGSRGEYELTLDGREMLSAAMAMYKNSTRRAECESERLQRSYRRGHMDAENVQKRVIKRQAIYQSCWLSYTGAMAGCLTALGHECDTIDVGGASGYSFIINVRKGRICPSGPTATHVRTFREMLKATESLGRGIEPYIYQHSYPTKEGAPTPRELEVVSYLFDRIRREIDADRPVVLWGLAAPEYGIVNGYEGQSYIVSTFRSTLSQGHPEEPIPFHNLNAPGCIDAFYFKPGERTSESGTFLDESLSRALRFGSADMPVLKGYVAGPEAYEEWASVLLDSSEGNQDYLGNSYMGACVAEGRAMSSAYLGRVSSKVPSAHRQHLALSSREYDLAAKAMESFSKLFPFKFEGEMTDAARRNGAEMLREAQSHEEAALRALRKAVH